ncbi:aspartate aminotransferase family protein [Acuticoccus sediminis]|uniref:Aspartate aminotransferase family protein n=1 Tax=Acuticoccus sediminis TaxID=2184697 RepID=A0A8B2P1N8_9HYPH|nr:aminotransferase class III-fold pyridoxal phosphate-dependent enzyme [Acuticoccus sediminis]RAI02187.1 aspartate aminotransferase family protein [Acuticoccus sediminis]
MRHLQRLAELRDTYVAAHPESRRIMSDAAEFMPGGNTRSVLHFDPFPMVIASGDGATVTDVDGHTYIDCAGEFSAGLYGHNDPVIRAAQEKALSDGLVLAAPNRYEAGLAREMCVRFPSLDRVRFCNSGTEANVFALLTARNFTGRSRFMFMEEGYHGGVLTFGGGKASRMNAPFDHVLAPFNDIDAALATIRANKDELAAVMLEPLLGAGGNLLADKAFLEAVRAETQAHGILLIFDEVKTSRLGRSGLQGHFGVTPDMTTFGKYIGGGLSFGAFGGREEIMMLFDPSRPDALMHAGTFNNNVMSMAGGLAGLSEVFTADRADAFLDMTEATRAKLGEALAAKGVPVRPSGFGSMMSLHIGEREPRRWSETDSRAGTLRSLVHLAALEEGLVTTPRGDLYLSLPMTEAMLDDVVAIISGAVAREFPYVAGQMAA